MINTIQQALSRMSRGSSGDIVATSSSDDDEMKSDGEDTDDDCATTTTASSDLTNLTESDGVNILSEATQRRAAISHRARSLQRLGVRAGTAFHRMLADSRLVLLCCWGWDAGLCILTHSYPYQVDASGSLNKPMVFDTVAHHSLIPIPG